MDRNYYIYEHREADTGRTFYVGKGNRKRAWRKDSRNPQWHHIVRRHGFSVVITHEGLSHTIAESLEAQIIAAYGRENLCNLTDGGGGSFGFSHAPETRQRMSEAKKGKTGYKHSPEARLKMSDASKGRKPSAESIAKMRESKRGWKMTPEQREKAIAVLRANPPQNPSAETRAKQSESAKNRGKDITLSHPDHGVVTAKHSTFKDKYGMDPGHLSRLLKGVLKKHRGWMLP